MRRHSSYALDFYTAVLIFSFYKDWTPEEIETEINRGLTPLLFSGPRLKTIERWLELFKQDANDYSSFFIKQLLEHNLNVPSILPLEKQAEITDYKSHYFLECISALYCGIHPKSKYGLKFLWYANRLIEAHFKSGLFIIRPP